jgi:hypothetical protein
MSFLIKLNVAASLFEQIAQKCSLRTLWTMLFVSIIHISMAQGDLSPLPVTDGRVVYTGIVEVTNSSKEELFARARKWIALTYKSAKDVIQLEDKESGELVAKGILLVPWMMAENHIFHTFSISVKNDKFRYIIDALVVSRPSTVLDNHPIEQLPKSWGGKKNLYEKVDKEIKRTIASLETAMRSDQKNDDW